METANNDSKASIATRRSMAGLQPGRIVNYVLKDGTVRPMIVVQVWTPECVNGVVFLNGTNDDLRHDLQNERGHGVRSLCTAWAVSASYGDPACGADDPAALQFQPYTWHWPARRELGQTVASATAGNVRDIAELESQVAALAATSERIERALAALQEQLQPSAGVNGPADELQPLMAIGDSRAKT